MFYDFFLSVEIECNKCDNEYKYKRYLHTIPVERHQLNGMAIIMRIVCTNNFQLQNFAIFLPLNMRGQLKVFGGKYTIVFVSRI